MTSREDAAAAEDERTQRNGEYQSKLGQPREQGDQDRGPIRRRRAQGQALRDEAQAEGSARADGGRLRHLRQQGRDTAVLILHLRLEPQGSVDQDDKAREAGVRHQAPRLSHEPGDLER